MTPAPSAGSEGTKKKRRRKRPAHRAPLSTDSPAKDAQVQNKRPAKGPAKSYAKRVDEVSAGGLVIAHSGKNGLLIGRRAIIKIPREREFSGHFPRDILKKAKHQSKPRFVKSPKKLGSNQLLNVP